MRFRVYLFIFNLLHRQKMSHAMKIYRDHGGKAPHFVNVHAR
jgi:hypothetical protein